MLRHLEVNRRAIAIRALMFVGLVAAIDSEAHAQLLPIKVYTTADGLARDRVTRIRKDSRGFLWFCTEEGLSRFDGYRFTNYTTADGLPSANVQDFIETRDGNYLVGTIGGLCRFDPYRTVSSSKDPVFIPILPDPGAALSFGSFLEDSRGTIWCGTSQGLYELERGTAGWRLLRHEDIKAGIHNIIEDRSGAIWMASNQGVYRRQPDGRVEHYGRQNGLPSRWIRGLLEHSDGSIWVGTILGICQLKRDIVPGGNVVARIIDRHQNIPIGCQWLYEAPNGNIWACVEQGLLELRGEKEDYRSRLYTTTEGLSGLFVWNMIEDRDGNIWIATNAGGVMKMARNGLTTWRRENGLGSDFVTGICENRAGELLVTSTSPEGHLLSRFHSEGFIATRPSYPKEFTTFGDEAQQTVLQDHSGEWWIPTAGGLVRYPKTDSVEELAHTRPKAVYRIKDWFGNYLLFRIFEDSRGDIWMGAFVRYPNSLLIRWERKTEKFHNYLSESGTPPGTPAGFAEDRSGNLWIAFHSGYVARFSNEKFTSFRLTSPPPGRRLHDVYCDRAGRIWIGSGENGVFRVDNPTDEQPRFINYTVDDGLSSNDVWDITEDNFGNIYLGTGRGLDRLNPTTMQVKHYTTLDGLTNNYVLMVYRDRHGAIWAGTQRGVSRLIPQPDPPTQPPPVFISSSLIAGAKFPVAVLGENSVTVPDLAPGRNQLNIDFFGLSLAVGETLRYQYLLEGASNEWSEPSERRSVDFANLNSGSYRFLVRAITTDGTVSPNPASVTFRILPPVWQRWWFLALASILVASAAVSIRALRNARRRERERVKSVLREAKEERLRELEQVRRRIAADLHDEIGSNLTRISLLSEVAQRKVGTSDKPVKQQLSSIAKLSREVVDSMSEIVWAINPHKDRLGDLSQRMRHFASDLLTARQIEFRFLAADLNRDVKVGANVRRECLLIFKEGVNNIVRHSCCTEVEIEFRAENNHLLMTLSDNGKGFDVVEQSDGHGLSSMRERTRALGGNLEVDSGHGRGTRLTLTIPLRYQAQEFEQRPT
jgi:signal transduction histidine kinase/ligand-binding sensor domain-containing protein